MEGGEGDGGRVKGDEEEGVKEYTGRRTKSVKRMKSRCR